MKRFTHMITVALGMALVGTGANAACIVEYKAKRDNPLALFYDVAQVGGDCTRGDATARLREKLAREGLTLLKVLSVTKQ